MTKDILLSFHWYNTEIDPEKCVESWNESRHGHKKKNNSNNKTKNEKKYRFIFMCCYIAL